MVELLDKTISENVSKNKTMLEASDYKLIDYFNQLDKIIIPLYQRGYSWEDKHIDVFIKDIYNNTNYYIGNIMGLPNGNDIELIDGQQRIISSYIILCCLKNKFDIDYDFSFLKKGKKIEVVTRAPSNEIKILEQIYNDDIPNNSIQKKEVKVYKKVYRTIIDNKLDYRILLKKILDVIIVEIKFMKNETDAHNMFVNLNTKGKSLEDVDVLKSQLFKYLALDEVQGIEFYKEGWYETINAITEKNAQRYFDNFSDIFFPNIKDKKIDIAIKYINNLLTAKEYYDNFSLESEQKNCLCKCAMTVYNHSITYLNNIYDGNISLDVLDNYLKLLEKAKFKQFDIVLISLLHIRDNSDRNKFIKNYEIIKKFIKFILMHQEIMSINKASPSLYGTDFKKAGYKLFVDKDYKKYIREFLTGNLKIHSEEHICSSINNLKITHSNTVHAKQILMLIEEIVVVDMNVEHFLLFDETDEDSMKIGNCIPVSKDIYGSLNISDKLKKYEDNKNDEPFIKKFLQYKITEDNYVKKIQERTESISVEYVKIYNELYEKLIKE